MGFRISLRGSRSIGVQTHQYTEGALLGQYVSDERTKRAAVDETFESWKPKTLDTEEHQRKTPKEKTVIKQRPRSHRLLALNPEP